MKMGEIEQLEKTLYNLCKSYFGDKPEEELKLMVANRLAALTAIRLMEYSFFKKMFFDWVGSRDMTPLEAEAYEKVIKDLFK
jgi:hypothetical protein